MAGTAGQGWERRPLTGLCMGGEQRPKSRGGRENAGSCWTSSLFSPGVVKPRTASHFSSAYFGLLATLAVASQMKSTLHSPYGGKNLVNWMHTALHTHCVLAPGPAVLQTLAKWEAFCAVEKKIWTGEARLWLIRCNASQKKRKRKKKKKESKKKLKRLLHTLQQRGIPARWAGAASLHFSPSYCVFKSTEGLHPMHTVPSGNLCWDPANAALIEMFGIYVKMLWFAW